MIASTPRIRTCANGHLSVETTLPWFCPACALERAEADCARLAQKLNSEMGLNLLRGEQVAMLARFARELECKLAQAQADCTRLSDMETGARLERDRLGAELVSLRRQSEMDTVRFREMQEAGQRLEVELAALRQTAEVAERDAGLYAATLHLSAIKLGCDKHMVDHAVEDLLNEVATLREDRARLDWLDKVAVPWNWFSPEYKDRLGDFVITWRSNWALRRAIDDAIDAARKDAT